MGTEAVDQSVGSTGVGSPPIFKDGCIVAVDFGSTYTKCALLDVHRGVVVTASASPSTVGSDVNEGLKAALGAMARRSKVEMQEDQPILASSSAGGGLRVAAAGLTAELSLEAARRAALGAGAKLVAALGGKLGARDIKGLDAADCDIILLAGGTDGGDTETILANAESLAGSGLDAWFVVAGNRSASDDCANLLESRGKRVLVTNNLLPDFDHIETGPANQAIRDIFMRHIVQAKGINELCRPLLRRIVPTPHAILRATRLLATGSDRCDAMEAVLTIDVGGATTDVHSFSSTEPVSAGVFVKGLPEDREKRTVEGDLGIRINAQTLTELAGPAKVAANTPAGPLPMEKFARYLEAITKQPSRLPLVVEEDAMDCGLARAALEIAVDRHAGTRIGVFTPTGRVEVQRGKDLAHIRAIVGVGGVFAYGADPGFVLEGAFTGTRAPEVLRPIKADLFVDTKYALFAAGLLADIVPDEAIRIARDSLTRL